MFRIIVLISILLISTTSFAATVVLQNSEASSSEGITDTNYYCIAAPSSTCPALPWTTPTKVTVAGAATTGTVKLPANIGQTICCYGTYQAGAAESIPSNIATGIVPPKGMVIVGPLVIM